MAHRTWRLVLGAVLALSAGCGGGEDAEIPQGVAPRAWAHQVCTGFVTWQAEIAAASGPLREPLTGDLTAAKTALIGFLDQATARTDALLQKISDAGTPAVEDGEALSRDFERAVGEIREGLATSRERADSLPPHDPPAFEAGVAQVGANLRNGRQRLQNRLDEAEENHDSPELTKALDGEPACSRVYEGPRPR